MPTFQQFLVDSHNFDTLADLWNDFCQEESDMGNFIYSSIEDLADFGVWDCIALVQSYENDLFWGSAYRSI